MFISRPRFCKFLSLIEMWGWLIHFSITNFLCIYDYMLKKGLTVSIFNISTFSMVLCLFLLDLMEIFRKSHNFSNKTIVKHYLTVVGYFETMTNIKLSTINHYLTNCNTKNLHCKEGIIM